MKTLTEIENEEAQQRERAWQYEKATVQLRDVRNEITRLTPRAAHYREQVAALDVLTQQTQTIDAELVGVNGHAARAAINLNITAARANAAARLQKIEGQLATLTAQVPRMEALVKKLEG
jgi:hypothetical protein